MGEVFLANPLGSACHIRIRNKRKMEMKKSWLAKNHSYIETKGIWMPGYSTRRLTFKTILKPVLPPVSATAFAGLASRCGSRTVNASELSRYMCTYPHCLLGRDGEDPKPC